MKNFFKYCVRNILIFFLHSLWIFPIKKNRIMFESNGGRIIGDNPFYIYKHLKEKKLPCDFIWSKRNNTFIPENVTKTVKFHTLKYIFAMLTARVIVDDSGFPSYIPFRKKQILIDTWHGGGAYKRVDAVNKESENSFIRQAQYTTYFLSSSRKFSDVMAKSCFISEKKYLPIGMPRNDLFFMNDKMNAVNMKVRGRLKLSVEDFIILYAPTYRGCVDSSNLNFTDMHLDIKKIKDAALKKFNRKVVFLLRMHPDLDLKKSLVGFDADVSSYPYMQELLCAADMLITDYSSSVWDFSFTNKPGFLFVPDLDKYEKNRGFYTPISTWPFTYAKTNGDLVNAISDWTLESQMEKNRKHHELLGNYENGQATEKVCELIERNLFDKKERI